jgi:hypothetical protein
MVKNKNNFHLTNYFVLVMLCLTINDGVNMDIIATIKHNDPEIDERVSLGIVAEDGGFAIRTATGEDAGQYRWTTEGEAKAAIAHLWSAGAWDLQWEI